MRLYERILARDAVDQALSDYLDEQEAQEAQEVNSGKNRGWRDFILDLWRVYPTNGLNNELIVVTDIKIPWAEMWKDVKDTMKPYKVSMHILRDLLGPPIYGIYHIIVGSVIGVKSFVGNIIRSPIALSALLASPFSKTARNYLNAYCTCIVRDTGAILAHIVRGVTQIAAWPLTILRVPFRLGITWYNGAPQFEDNQGLRKLIKQHGDTEDSNTQRFVARVLGEKFLKAKKRGQISTLDFKQAAWKLLETDDAQHNIRMITLFKQAIYVRDNEVKEQKAAKQKKCL